MKTLEHRIPPPAVFLLIASGMWLAGEFAPVVEIDRTLRLGLAAAFAALGGVAGGLGFRAFGRASTTIDPVHIDRVSALVTTGIYRITRNPMYLALTLLLCAWACCLGFSWALLGPPSFVAFITRFQIMPEERVLTAMFGGAYADYRRSVRRWI